MPCCSGNGPPSSFAAGDSVVFSYADPGYPSSAWTLKLFLISQNNPTGIGVTLPAATANTDGSFTFTLAPTDTGKLAPGRYTAGLSATANAGGTRIGLTRTSLFVYPDLSVPLVQSPAMKALAALQAVNAGAIQSYSGGGVTWSKRNLGELRKEIDRLTVIVENQLRELGLSTKGGAITLLARF